MRSIIVRKFGGPEVLTLEKAQKPKQGHGQVLIRVHAAGVNPVDTYIRSGMFGDGTKVPYVPGFDGAGVVEDVGNGVTRIKAGDRVFCFSHGQGTYSEYCVCPEDECWPLPSALMFSQGAAIGIPYFTAYCALFQSDLSKASKSVLVHGASGGVGLAAVQLAKQAGMIVYGTAGTEDGMKVVSNSGADHVFNHKTNDHTKKIMDSTKGHGVDLILEMLANVNLPKDIQLISQGGTIAVIGSRGSVTRDPGQLKRAQCKVVDIAVLNSTKDQIQAAGTAILDGLENGALVPVIDKEYQMEDASKAHKDIIESKGAKGKLVILTHR